MKASVFLMLISLYSLSSGAKILVVWSLPAKSHFNLGSIIFEKLAEKGHQVTVICPFALDDSIKGITQVTTSEVFPYMKTIHNDLIEMGQKNVFRHMDWVIDVLLEITEITVRSEKVQNLLHSGEQFDVVVFEEYFNPVWIGLGNHFNCPVILVNPMPCGWNDYMFSNPRPSSYIPNLMGKFGSKMNLWQRLENFIYDVYEKFNVQYRTLPKNAELLEKYISNTTSLYDILYNVSLILVNSHPSINMPVPRVPAMIEIGGYHVRDIKPLPKDIAKFLDNAKEGVVLFSMGSNLKMSDISDHLRNAFLKGLASIKEKVLLKFETELPDKPHNVMIMEWLPQNDILGHPNIKAFISHGGILSTIEAAYHGVPILGIPAFADQRMNMVTAEEKGNGISLPLSEVTEETFRKALNEILTNSKYQENAKMLSRFFHDRPMKPIDLAIYWIEFVIRHKGATHLRVAGLNLKWYQRDMIDIAVITILILVTLLVILYKVVCITFRNKVQKNISTVKKNN